jgi:hypothetical protein
MPKNQTTKIRDEPTRPLSVALEDASLFSNGDVSYIRDVASWHACLFDRDTAAPDRSPSLPP